MPTKVPDNFEDGEPNARIWKYLLRWHYPEALARRPKSVEWCAEHAESETERHRRERMRRTQEESILAGETSDEDD